VDAREKFQPCLSLALLLAAGLQASGLEQQTWTGRYPLPPAGRLAVENVQGNIRVEGWDRAEVEITVIKTALSPASRLDDVRVAVEFGYRALAVRTVYLGESGDPVRVDYRVRVPRQVRLDSLRTVVGDVAVRNVEGAVSARTLSGNIEAMDVSGSVGARAVNGSIVASIRTLAGAAGPVELETVSGNIDLVLPSRPNANLELSTVAGKIVGKYVFVASGVPGDHTRRARLGRGGVQVRLRTVRGTIRVAEQEEVL